MAHKWERPDVYAGRSDLVNEIVGAVRPFLQSLQDFDRSAVYPAAANCFDPLQFTKKAFADRFGKVKVK